MEKIEIVKSVRRKAASLGFPLSVLLEMVNINRAAYNNWVVGIFNPSHANLERLNDLLVILKAVEDLKKKRSKDAKR